VLAILPAEGSAGRLAVIARAPEFSLTTQDGKNFRDSELKGKVVLVGFIFTTCNGTCPATTHRMASIQQELKRRGLDKDGRVQLLSISLDPARDKPETLKSYMRLYDVDPSNWTFVTGDPADVNKAIAAWGMWARQAANGQLDHPSRVFLLDGLGRIREIYNLTFLKPTWVCEDIELLLHEQSKASSRP
jgi:protein SCO1/2